MRGLGKPQFGPYCQGLGFRLYRRAHLALQCTTQGARTKPEASTKEWRGLMIMSGVGTTYGMGAAAGKRSGSHRATGMLYFTSCSGVHPVRRV